MNNCNWCISLDIAYISALTVWDDNLRFLRKIPSVLFALLVMLRICLFHFRSLAIVIPRYLAESVIGGGRVECTC